MAGWCLFGWAAAGVPVFLDAGLDGLDSEAGELEPFAQAALEFGKAGEGGQGDDVVPEQRCVGLAGEPADDGAEERDTAGGLEVDDRGTDILAGLGQGFVGLGAELSVERVVLERVGKAGRQASLGDHRLRELPGAGEGRVVVARTGRGVEGAGTDRGI